MILGRDTQLLCQESVAFRRPLDGSSSSSGSDVSPASCDLTWLPCRQQEPKQCKTKKLHFVGTLLMLNAVETPKTLFTVRVARRLLCRWAKRNSWTSFLKRRIRSRKYSPHKIRKMRYVFQYLGHIFCCVDPCTAYLFIIDKCRQTIPIGCAEFQYRCRARISERHQPK